MTEQDWLRSCDIRALITAVRGKGTERLWRLFAVACAQRVADSMCGAKSLNALEVARRFADGAATREELLVARAHAEAAAYQAGYEEWLDEARANFRWDAEYAAACEAKWAAGVALRGVAVDMGEEPGDDFIAFAEGWLAPDLLREIFGNPFRWTTLDPAWLAHNEGTASQLAQRIYDDSAFDLLPILHDALLDAGCDDEALLAHCRSDGPHVRGCWAVDLILGKQ